MAKAVVIGLAGADALHRRVDTDPGGELEHAAAVASSPRASMMSVAPNVRDRAWRAGLRLRAMIRSAPRRCEASTAERPTAPSPTTATVPPAGRPR